MRRQLAEQLVCLLARYPKWIDLIQPEERYRRRSIEHLPVASAAFQDRSQYRQIPIDRRRRERYRLLVGIQVGVARQGCPYLDDVLAGDLCQGRASQESIQPLDRALRALP